MLSEHVPTAGKNLPFPLQPTDTSAVLQISQHQLKIYVVLSTAIGHTVQGKAIPVLPMGCMLAVEVHSTHL